MTAHVSFMVLGSDTDECWGFLLSLSISPPLGSVSLNRFLAVKLNLSQINSLKEAKRCKSSKFD